jgi:hypothetical protein
MAKIEAKAMSETRATRFTPQELRDAGDEADGHRLDAMLHQAASDADRLAALEKSWRCFHCGMVITDEFHARDHFGGQLGDATACVLSVSDVGLIEQIRRRDAKLAALPGAIEQALTEFEKLPKTLMEGGELAKAGGLQTVCVWFDARDVLLHLRQRLKLITPDDVPVCATCGQPSPSAHVCPSCAPR